MRAATRAATRALRWITPVLLVSEVVLVLSARLSLAEAAVVLVAVESALALAVHAQAAVAVRGYAASRGAGATRASAAEAALRAALPGPLARVVLHEARLVASLVLWARRRRDGVPPGATAIPYDRDGRALGVVLLGVSVVEVVAVELLVPWTVVRAVLLVLGVYGVVLVLALLADTAVRPHVLTDDALRLRVGGWADVTLPLGAISGMRRRLRSSSGFVTFTHDGLALSSSSATCVEVDLDEPRELRVGGRSGVVRTIHFSADDPAGAVAALAAVVRARRPV